MFGSHQTTIGADRPHYATIANSTVSLTGARATNDRVK